MAELKNQNKQKDNPIYPLIVGSFLRIINIRRPVCDEGVGMKKKPNVFDIIRSKPLLSLAIGGLIFFIGILISDAPTMIVSQGWPTTDGTIITNRIVGQKIKEYDGDYYSHFDVYIRYQYSVNDISYSSTSVNSIDSSFYPVDIASRYPVGKDVIVYYNPKNPSDAVLEPGFVDIFKAFDIFSYIIFGAGVYFIFLGILRIKKISDIKRGKM
jgi:hypothetical protein